MFFHHHKWVQGVNTLQAPTKDSGLIYKGDTIMTL